MLVFQGLYQWSWARRIGEWCLPQRQDIVRAAHRTVFEAKHAARCPLVMEAPSARYLFCLYEHQGLYQCGHGHDKLVAHLVAHMVGILPRTLKPCRAYKIMHLGEYMYILLFLAVDSQL